MLAPHPTPTTKQELVKKSVVKDELEEHRSQDAADFNEHYLTRLERQQLLCDPPLPSSSPSPPAR